MITKQEGDAFQNSLNRMANYLEDKAHIQEEHDDAYKSVEEENCKGL